MGSDNGQASGTLQASRADRAPVDATDPLKRNPTYNASIHLIHEQQIADALAFVLKVETLKIGNDDPNRMKSRVDRAIVRSGVITGFFEAKWHERTFGDLPKGYDLPLQKVKACRQLHGVTYLPVKIVLRFREGLYVLDPVETLFSPCRYERHDGRNHQDENGALYPWTVLRPITLPEEAQHMLGGVREKFA